MRTVITNTSPREQDAMATQREGWWAMRGARMWWVGSALLAMVVAVAGCGSESGSVRVAPTATPTTPQPTATATLTVPMRTVTFMTPDGLRLGGTLYGSGTVGV